MTRPKKLLPKEMISDLYRAIIVETANHNISTALKKTVKKHGFLDENVSRSLEEENILIKDGIKYLQWNEPVITAEGNSLEYKITFNCKIEDFE